MITVLIDTDVLIDVALGREEFVTNSSKILDLAEGQKIKTFIAWHSISNFYYIVESDNSSASSIEFIRELLRFVKISSTTTQDALFAIDLHFSDFEDALQVAAAKKCSADFIITRNVKHYKNSPVTAINPGMFIKKLN